MNNPTDGNNERELDDAIKQLFLDGIVWGRENPYGTPLPPPSKFKGIAKVEKLYHQQLEAKVKPLSDSDRWNYERLKALELRGIEDYDELRKAEPLTPERVVAFINQLSPWNLKTTGLSVLSAYTDKVSEAKVAGVQMMHLSDLSRAVGILQGLGHPDKYLEDRRTKMLDHLTTNTKGESHVGSE